MEYAQGDEVQRNVFSAVINLVKIPPENFTDTKNSPVQNAGFMHPNPKDQVAKNQQTGASTDQKKNSRAVPLWNSRAPSRKIQVKNPPSAINTSATRTFEPNDCNSRPNEWRFIVRGSSVLGRKHSRCLRVRSAAKLRQVVSNSIRFLFAAIRVTLLS